MKRRALLCTMLAAAVFLVVPAVAQTWVPVGTATGGVAVYFNDTNEVPANVSYLRVQYANSTTNVNGGWISMFEPFKTIFGDLGQYGIDAIYVAPTNTNLNPPVLYAYDWSGSTPIQDGQVLWAMNVYSDWTQGPKNPSAYVLNSTLRGTSGSVLNFTLTPLGGGDYKADLDVILNSDGFIHWYHPPHGTSPFPYPFSGRFRAAGTLYYYRQQDNTPGMDFYQGSVNLYAEAIPDASTLSLFAIGLVPLAARLRFRKV